MLKSQNWFNSKQNILLLVIFLLLTGCSTGATPSTATTSEPETGSSTPAVSSEAAETAEAASTQSQTESAEQEEVTVLTRDPLQTLEPYAMVRKQPEASVAAHIWDTLTRVDDNLTLAPMLAKEWQLVNDKTWQFNLQEGVQFHNGEPFNAAAAKFSLERAINLPVSLKSIDLDSIIERVEVVDDYTLQIHTDSPQANLPFLLADIQMLPPVYYSETPDIELRANPVGSGPYQVTNWSLGEPLVLKAYPDYWQGRPRFSEITFNSLERVDERLAALQAGQADIVTNLTPDQKTSLADSGQAEFVPIESTKRLFVGLRSDPGTPLADPQVRQALNYAVDVEALVSAHQAGFGQRYGNWVLSADANPALTPIPYDPEKAKSLLAEAGFKDGFQTTLDVPEGQYLNDTQIAQSIAAQLADVEVDVTVQPYDWETYVTNRLIPRQTSPMFLLALASEGNALVDTQNLSFSFPFNPTEWLNADFEENLRTAQETFNNQRQQRLLHQAQAAAYEDAPWIWLWRLYDFYGVNKGLNWSPRPDGLIYLYESLPDSNAAATEEGN